MRGTAFHCPLRAASRQEAIDQSGSKRVAAADAIEDFEVFRCGASKNMPSAQQMAPQSLMVAVFASRSVVPTTLRSGIRVDDAADHGFEGVGIERGEMLVHTLDLKPRRR